MITLSPERGWIFRITHLDNIPWILKNGLHCRNSGVYDPQYHDIGNPDLIEKRHNRPVPIPPGGTLSDYIPFYFTPYSPMLLNIKTGYHGMKQTPMSEIAILAASLHQLAKEKIEFVLTDRHAYLATAKFARGLAGLDRLDWTILQQRDFKRDPEDPGKIERYQAEALIHGHLPLNALTCILCQGVPQEEHLQGLVGSAQVTMRVLKRPDCYF